eukprot:TRINITY_DN3349_c0_g1_i1.p1 TRINITY_DN3349_c0_g1~~TRINITY_DN3349_c0_g1_i1.p1  ORF type:complete len:645 (+),score=133.13 TRINITY_DN3349_c0_g1_i1:96-2030(+)
MAAQVLMALISCVLAVAAAAEAAAEGGVVLVQKRVSRHPPPASQSQASSEALPASLQHLLDDADAKAEALAQGLESLEQSEHAKWLSTVNQQRQSLSMQLTAINLKREFNKNLAAEVKRTERTVRSLRRKAAHVNATNTALLKKIDALKANFSLAKTLIERSVSDGDEELELERRFLSELKTNATRASESIAASMAIERSKKQSVLLQKDAEDEDPRTLLASMSSALDSESAEEAAKLNSSKAAFESKSLALSKRMAEVTDEQSQLNASLRTERLAVQRVGEAVDYLSSVHTKLQERYDSIRQDLRNVGEYHPVSLLQVVSEKEWGRQVQTDPLEDTLMKVNSELGTLQHSLADMEQRRKTSLQEQGRKYEAKLKEQRTIAKVTEAKNEELSKQISVVERSIAELRQNATDLLKANTGLEKDIAGLTANVTLVQEYINRSLNWSDLIHSNLSDLKILSELSHEEDTQNQAKLHNEQLSQIEDALKGEVASLLQVNNNNKKKDAAEILETLNSSLDLFASEQNSSEELLAKKFEHEMSAVVARQKSLLQDQEGLNATLAMDVNVQRRLKLAISRLQEKRAYLKNSKASLLAYMHKLVAKPKVVMIEERGLWPDLKQKVASASRWFLDTLRSNEENQHHDVVNHFR